MAFGFPAYHQEEHDYRGCTRGELMGAALDALDELGWGGKDVGGWQVLGSTGVSFWSWGERITIKVRPGPALFIRSHCSLPTQCIDWGRNRENVRRFLDEVEHSIRHVQRRDGRERRREEKEVPRRGGPAIRPPSPSDRRPGPTGDAIRE
jgi:hypothetical protein